MRVGPIAGAIQRVRRVALAVSVALFPASPAGAQAGWTSTPTDLSGPDAYGSPVVGVDAAGNALAVWNGATGLQAARYTRASGTWSSPDVLNTDRYAVLSLFVHPGGNAILTWWLINDYDYLVGARAQMYMANTGTWSDPTEFSQDGPLVDGVIDGHGNAIVVWAEWNGIDDFSGANWVIKTAYYNRVAGTWSPASDVSNPEGIYGARLTLDSNDSAILVWNGPDRLNRIGRFIPSAGSWAQSVAFAGLGGPNIAVDRSGNATVMWITSNGSVVSVHAAHYASTTRTWSSPTSLSVGAHGGRYDSLSMASDDAGNTTAVWESFDGVQWTIQSATYSAASHSWSTAVASLRVPPNPSRFPSSPVVKVDATGNATVIWSDPSIHSVETARRTTAGSWSRHTIAPSGTLAPTVAVDGAGNAIAVWAAFRTPQNVIQSARWRAIPAAPTITNVTSSDGTLAVAFSAAAAPPWFGTINYEYSLDDGITWTPRSPASTASPLVVEGLSNGTSYTLRLRGVNNAGAGEASAGSSVVAGLAAPSELTAVSIVGHDVTLRWLPPTGSVAATGYVLEGGVTPGTVLGSLPIQGPASRVTFPAPTGVFFVRLHATAGGVRSLPSNEIVIRVGVPLPPSAPTGLLGLANGSTVSLAWQNSSSGGAPTGIILDVSGSSTDSFQLPLSERFTFAGVPAGTYTLAVRAFNTGGISGPSNSVTLSFPGTCSPPSTPTNFSAFAAGTLITASWSPPGSGAAPTEYLVEIFGTFNGTFRTTGLSWSGTFGQGNYTLRIRASNACGASDPTPSQTVSICTSPSGEGCWDYLRRPRLGQR